ncbi:hypothetical protein DWW10_16515 [Bacteroides intestinalis]|uniref:Uncharacterized protein n=1 Tax=Bacteroides intestinalis TaxID=329854 RepID=A0A412Y189_9BACE|nr:hypothetical protein DWW10_16515 [Bacteroides intestinalis]RHA62662.1 hypothetical protein DW932_03025 [Bacteroides intestinalis]
MPPQWHYFAIALAQHCHAYGTIVPIRWQEVGKVYGFGNTAGRLKLQGSKMIRQEEYTVSS